MKAQPPTLISYKILGAYLERIEDFVTGIIMDGEHTNEQRSILQQVLRTTKENQVKIMDLEDSIKNS